MQIIQNRRHFLAGAAAAGAAGLIGKPTPARAEPPPETTTVRIPAIPAACEATFYLAEELLREEGFTDVQYVPTTVVSAGMLADGQVDFSAIFSKLTQYGYDGWAVMEWECCIKSSEQGAQEGAPFIQSHLIQVAERSFDDFAGAGTDKEAIEKLLGLKR